MAIPQYIFTRAERVARNAKLLAKQITILVAYIDTIEASDYVSGGEKVDLIILTHAQALVEANRKFLALTQKLDALKVQADLAKLSANDLSEYAADSVKIADQVGEMDKIAYFGWARHTGSLAPELFTQGVKEVSTHAGGWEHLAALATAIDRLVRGK